MTTWNKTLKSRNLALQTVGPKELHTKLKERGHNYRLKPLGPNDKRKPYQLISYLWVCGEPHLKPWTKQYLSNTYIPKHRGPRQAQGTVGQHNPINHHPAVQEIFQVIPPGNEEMKDTKALWRHNSQVGRVFFLPFCLHWWWEGVQFSQINP